MRLSRILGIPTGPLWLPAYWIVQLAIAFVGICHYLVIERTVGLFSRRWGGSAALRFRWRLVPLLLAALPVALAIQLLVALWRAVVWWHRALGRWQFSGGDSWLGLAAGIVFEITFLVVFVGSFYHPLPWKLAGYSGCPNLYYPFLWYRAEGETPLRILLAGPAVFGAVMIFVLPTIITKLKLIRGQEYLFVPRYALA